MKLIVCGASGYIGRRLISRAQTAGVQVVGTSSRGNPGTLPLDLARAAEFSDGWWSAGDVLALAAAISAPDVCANDRSRALAVNVEGTGALVERALARGVRVAFFSSDTVYGERAEAFDESAPANPAGDYAQMKHAVEQRFAGQPGFKSLRLSYVFSRDDKFTKHLQACNDQGATAEIFHPFVRAVVHREDVVDGVLALARRWDAHPQSVFNFGGPQALSRVAFAETLRDAVWPRLRWAVVTPDDAFFRNRPRSIAMGCDGLAMLLGRTPRSIRAAAALEYMHPPEDPIA